MSSNSLHMYKSSACLYTTVHGRTHDSAWANTWQSTGEYTTVRGRTGDSAWANTWEHGRTHDGALANTRRCTGEHTTVHGRIHDSARANVDWNKTYEILVLNFSYSCNKMHYNYTQRCNLKTIHTFLLIPLQPRRRKPCSKMVGDRSTIMFNWCSCIGLL
jgi:hypothetical protein